MKQKKSEKMPRKKKYSDSKENTEKNGMLYTYVNRLYIHKNQNQI